MIIWDSFVKSKGSLLKSYFDLLVGCMFFHFSWELGAVGKICWLLDRKYFQSLERASQRISFALLALIWALRVEN